MEKKSSDQISLLYIDDNLRQRKNLNYVLKNNGFHVHLADGGWHGLHLLEQEEYEAVLVSKDIKDMLGREVVLLIRNKHPKDTLPIVMIAKEKTKEEVLESVDSGVNEFLGLEDPNKLIRRLKKLSGHKEDV